MVKIICNKNIDDGGAWELAQKLMLASSGEWSKHYDKQTGEYIPTTYDCLILDFKPSEEDYPEDFDIEPREGYYSEEDIKRWVNTQVVKLPPINISSIKFVRNEDSALIEIESDNDHDIRKLFYLFADLGNRGHSFGGLVRIYDGEGNIGSFGFDGDGADYIHSIDSDDDI